jgi:hypothetical protein
MAVETISYSAWKWWMECPYKHKLIKIDKIRLDNGGAHSCFGKAMHSTIEVLLLREKEEIENGGIKDDSFDAKEYFLKEFNQHIKDLDEVSTKKLDMALVKEMKKQGPDLAPLVLPAMKEYFGEYKFVASEQEIRYDIENFPNYEFHGFIDLVIQTADGKYHIIDWKSCSWGWDARKRASTEITYQLTFYKHYFCLITGASPDEVETHFGLLKRTAKENRIELFRVTSGEKKVKNALNILNNSIVNISRGKYIKNKLSCSRCEFHRTIHCP